MWGISIQAKWYKNWRFLWPDKIPEVSLLDSTEGLSIAESRSDPIIKALWSHGSQPQWIFSDSGSYLSIHVVLKGIGKISYQLQNMPWSYNNSECLQKCCYETNETKCLAYTEKSLISGANSHFHTHLWWKLILEMFSLLICHNFG